MGFRPYPIPTLDTTLPNPAVINHIHGYHTKLRKRAGKHLQSVVVTLLNSDK